MQQNYISKFFVLVKVVFISIDFKILGVLFTMYIDLVLEGDRTLVIPITGGRITTLTRNQQNSPCSNGNFNQRLFHLSRVCEVYQVSLEDTDFIIGLGHLLESPHFIFLSFADYFNVNPIRFEIVSIYRKDDVLIREIFILIQGYLDVW